LAPPLRTDSAFLVNVPTNVSYVEREYSQIGILTPSVGSSKDSILPLMGRPLFTSRNKFQYYTISNQHNNVKLPVLVKGRNGLSDTGVDELFDGDRIYVEGMQEEFRVTRYENATLRYLPFV
jgi:hypothetical protein